MLDRNLGEMIQFWRWLLVLRPERTADAVQGVEGVTGRYARGGSKLDARRACEWFNSVK